MLPKWTVALIVASYLILPPIFYLMKSHLHKQQKMYLYDYYAMALILVFLVIGGYQLYFWCQYNSLNQVYEIPETQFDKMIPKYDDSVYIYNFIYYIGFGLCLIAVKSYKQFVYILVAAFGLLITLSLFFITFPTKLPEHTRNKDEKQPFLKLTQKYDQLLNAFPSAHVALSVFVAFVAYPLVGWYSTLFPLLITGSCLTTKQHFTIDCVGGFVWGLVYSLLVKRVFNPKNY